MRSSSSILALLAAAAGAGVVFPVHAGPLEDLPVGHWLELPDTAMRGVDPCPTSDCSWSAVEGQAGVMDDWSGGSFDTMRDRLLVWGGGHGGYAGNELYAFELDTLAWRRLTDPSASPIPEEPYAADGGPSSRHTYNYVQYVASIDAFCSFGGAGFWPSGQSGTDHTDCYHFGSSSWQTHADSIFHGIGAATAYDPVADRVWGRGTGYSPDFDTATRLGSWDPQADAFVAHDGGNADLAYEYGMTHAIDPNRGMLVAVGNGTAIVWDISDPDAVVRSDLGATGDTEIEDTATPGLVFDANSDRIVAWGGGAAVHVLDLDAKTWTRVEPAADNVVEPTPPNGNGTFGRFARSAARNVFVVVNGVDENVFVVRLTDGAGVAVPTVSLSADPMDVPSGGSTTLQWEASNATGCVAAGAWAGDLELSGSREVGPIVEDSEFSISCTGPAGVGGQSVVVTVGGGGDTGTADDGGAASSDGGAGSAGDGSGDAVTAGDTEVPDTGAGDTAGPAADEGDVAAAGCGCRSGSGGLGAALGLVPWWLRRRRR